MDISTESRVAGHYGRGRLAGLALSEVAGADEFHIRGRAATAELGQALALAPGQRVLDCGCGLGGPSRQLAEAHGCRVVGLDLTEEYCQIAARLGGAAVDYVVGSALDLPFADGTFDAAYTQHVAMNIEDKGRLYSEIGRVLAPGRLFGLYDLLQGPGGAVHFPAPWAADRGTSFLVTPDQLRGLLTAAGFRILDWRDTTALALEWFQAFRPPPDSRSLLELLFGPEFRQMGRNQKRNLEEGRVLPTQVICRKL
jgi:SAM-dependent methyltransferase